MWGTRNKQMNYQLAAYGYTWLGCILSAKQDTASRSKYIIVSFLLLFYRQGPFGTHVHEKGDSQSQAASIILLWAERERQKTQTHVHEKGELQPASIILLWAERERQTENSDTCTWEGRITASLHNLAVGRERERDRKLRHMYMRRENYSQPP